MGRVYSVTIGQVAVSAAQDLFSILPAANKPVRIIGIEISQESDEGDAAAEMLPIQIIRGHTTVGSGGTAAPTPVPTNPADAAAGFTARINDTTIASAGTAAVCWASCINIQSQGGVVFPPEIRPVSVNANYIVVRLLAAPADAITVSATLWVEEEG